MRSATFRALSKAQATVKRARPSFHDATAPSMSEREAQAVEGDEGDGEQDAPLGPPRDPHRDGQSDGGDDGVGHPSGDDRAGDDDRHERGIGHMAYAA